MRLSLDGASAFPREGLPGAGQHDGEPRMNAAPIQRAVGTVLIVCPGGLEHGGGIGRMMGYFLDAETANPSGLTYEVVDSRGPWFLGAEQRQIGAAVGYLAGAMGQLLKARVATGAKVAHINITGRGSTLRKVVLTAFCRAIGLRYLLHVHDFDYADEYRHRGALMRFLIRRTFQGALTTLVLGKRDLGLLTDLLRLKPNQIQVLHNAVPDPGLLQEARPRSECHLLFLGHLSDRKGVPELLRALARPDVAAKPWRATLAGGGPIETYRGLAAELGIAERIDFPGWVDQAAVTGLCTTSDVLVLPSYAEGMAMSVLEGLSHGLAVVTTPVGAHDEVIEPERSGLLIPPGNVDALADALSRVIEDRGYRARLRAGARERFLDAFDVRGYREKLTLIHQEFLSR